MHPRRTHRVQMPSRRIASLFRRYAAAHLELAQPGPPLWDDTGALVGQVDRLTLRAGRMVVEGWTSAAAVSLRRGAIRVEAAPSQPRADVQRPSSALLSPGFALELPDGAGPVMLSLRLGEQRVVCALPRLRGAADRAGARGAVACVPARQPACVAAAPAVGRHARPGLPPSGQAGTAARGHCRGGGDGAAAFPVRQSGHPAGRGGGGRTGPAEPSRADGPAAHHRPPGLQRLRTCCPKCLTACSATPTCPGTSS